MQWDHYDYRISGHFLSALINDDWTGLEDSEAVAFKDFITQAEDCATDSGFSVGHWDADSEDCEDFGSCDVTGLHAMRCTVRLMVYKD